MGRAGDEGRYQHGQKQAAASVFFLRRGAQDQKIEHIALKMCPVGMAQHMAEQAEIGQRIGQTAPVDTEKKIVAPSAGGVGQQQRTRT